MTIGRPYRIDEGYAEHLERLNVYYAQVRPPVVFKESGQYKKPHKKACRWCHEPVAKGRRDYCSAACNLSRLCWCSWHDTRLYVFWRDKGRCVLCGLDVSMIERIRERLRENPWATVPEKATYSVEVIRFFPRALGFDGDNRIVFDHFTTWEIDHVTPRIIGGHNQPPNLRLLCVNCHKGETAELAKRRAAGRKTTARPWFEEAKPRQLGLWPKRKIPSRPLPAGRRLRG